MDERHSSTFVTLFQPSITSKNIEARVKYFLNSLEEKNLLDPIHKTQYAQILANKNKKPTNLYQRELVKLYLNISKK